MFKHCWKLRVFLSCGIYFGWRWSVLQGYVTKIISQIISLYFCLKTNWPYMCLISALLLFSTIPHYLHNTPCNVDTDVNQCMDKNGGCEQLCVDLPGAYRCSCFDGYLLAENNFNCTGTLYVTHISINATCDKFSCLILFLYSFSDNYNDIISDLFIK